MNVGRRKTVLNNLLIFIFNLWFCVTRSENQLIYILLWLRIQAFEKTPGSQYFIKQNCSFQNCFVTDNKSFYKDIKDFDVILFTGFHLYSYTPSVIVPPTRSLQQKYIFISSEPPTMYPVLQFYNGFFNYTFTYKLDSDVPWKFFAVRNKTDNTVIAPSKKHIQWIEPNDMEPINENIKRKLQNKNKAAVWLVSHCITSNNREHFIMQLEKELKKYGLSIDITGRWPCLDSYIGHLSPCNYWYETNGTYSEEDCFRWITENHYFYLAFENSMCEDYVTEKILTATKNFAVPVVLGGADYSRFLPKGSYIYANDLEPRELASVMNELIHDKDKYYEYFKWHRYYSIHHHTESSDTDGVCALCAFLNDNKNEFVSSVYTHITWFWK